MTNEKPADVLPSELVVPMKIVLLRAEFERLVEMIETPPAPAEALRKLLDSDT